METQATGSEKIKALAPVVSETLELAREVILSITPDESISETSLAYFAGQVAGMLVAARRFEQSVNRIDKWHREAVETVNAN
jgi:hypothetical protein